jgi:nucleoid-associated protein YgaU
MTRETKIALLVGLVFIICFGVILGNAHNNGAPLPRPSVGAAVEANRLLSARPPLAPEPAAVTPPLPAIASTSSSGGMLMPVQASGTIGAMQEVRPTPPPAPAAPEPAAQAPQSPAPDKTAQEKPAAEKPAQKAAAVAPVAAGPSKTYKVAEHDTLYSITRKFYGKAGEENYKLILEANRATLAGPDKLQVGQELVIPAAPAAASSLVDAHTLPKYLETLSPGSTAAAASPAAGSSELPKVRSDALVKMGTPAAKPAEAKTAEAKPSEQAPHAAPVQTTASKKTYTVRAHDCLASIARAQMKDGSDAAVTKLFAANRDKLSAPDKLSVGTVLVIPN